MTMVKVLIEMPEELRDELKRSAFDHKTTMGAITIAALVDKLQRQDIQIPARRVPGRKGANGDLVYCLNLKGQRVIAPRFLQPQSVLDRMPSTMTEEARTAYYKEQFGDNWQEVQPVE